MEGPEFTLRQVADHKTPADAWIVVHGQVYNVTSYVQDHPGGIDVLLECAGTDASEQFENAGHSDDASEIMATYRVGKLQGGAKSNYNVKVQTEDSTPETKSATSAGKTVVKFGAAAVVALSAVGLYHVADSRGISLALPHFLRFAPRRTGTQGLGFFDGLLITSAVFTVAGAILSKAALSSVMRHPTFRDYPEHIKVEKRPEVDILNQSGWLHPTDFQTLPLVKKELVAPNTYRLIFELPTPNSILGLPIGQHVAITATVDGQAVTRSYTPVSNNADRGKLELIIKCYPEGKLTGGYLAKLEVGDEVKFRGPKGAMRYRRGLCKTIGMVAGGSGITPMYQLIRAICEDRRDTTEINLIYANRTEEDILMRVELDAFARRYPKNLKIHYVLDNPPAEWQGGSGFVTSEMMAERLPGPDADTKIMLCGPPPMVNGAKKALVQLGFTKPGVMSKMGDQIFCF